MLLLKFTLLLLLLQNLFFMFYVRSEFNSLRTAVTIIQHILSILDMRICSYVISERKDV